MYDDQILSKQGPLAHIWLAANYDKKLSRQQLMGMNIVQSSKFISKEQNKELSEGVAGSGTKGAITLRLSGQLLLGIVRIYSRKTKYLLDDVNEILYRLKSSFRYAVGGGALGSDKTFNVVNAPLQQTMLANVTSITLADNVTEYDLLYQDDLDLHDSQQTNLGMLFSQVSNAHSLEDSTFDRSIEIPRGTDAFDESNRDDDLELDFDLGMENDSDMSIEIGRNAPQVSPNADMTGLSDLGDVTDKGMEVPDFDLDLDLPLETIDEPDIHNDSMENEPQQGVVEQPTERHRPKHKLVGIGEDGRIRTTKRKLKIDTLEDIETGLPLQELKNNQQRQLEIPAFQTFTLSDTEKLSLIYALSEPYSFPLKKRKMWSIDDALKHRCEELAQANQETGNSDTAFDKSFQNLDFDISLQGLDFDFSAEEANHQLSGEQSIYESPIDQTVKSSAQVKALLRHEFLDRKNAQISLDYLITKDCMADPLNEERLPLGTISTSRTTAQDPISVNKRTEASRCFFELLVLATNDYIALSQDNSTDGAAIKIRAKDKIFTQIF